MAAQVLFKSACPSCEKLIAIRDEGLIGKKVECPQCKYKFIVEEPEGFRGSEAGTAESGSPKKARKKSQTNVPLLIGAGVGTVAVAALAFVAYLVFSGEDKPQPARPTAPVVAQNTPPPTDAATPPADATTPPADATTPPADAAANANPPAAAPAAAPSAARAELPAAGASGDITNMLPNDSMMVVAIAMDKMRFSTFGEQMFESKVGFRPGAFKEKIGIPQENMLALVRGENTEQKWTFNVLRTEKPVDVKEIGKSLTLKKGSKSPIMGREYWEIGPNELLDNIAAALKPEAELRARKDRSAGPMAMCQLDQTTLVFATQEILEEFLRKNAKPKQLSKPSKSASGEGDPATPPAAPQGRGRGMAQPAGSATLESMSALLLQNEDDAQITDNATFLTIEPPLKAMMDRLNSDPKVKPIVSVVANMQADPKIFQRIRSLTGGLLPSPAGMRIFGMTITQYNLEKFFGNAAIEFFNENDVKEIENALKRTLPVQARLLALWLGGIKIETEGTDGAGAASGPPGGGAPVGPPGGGGPAGPPPGGGANPFLPGLTQNDEGPVSKLRLKRKARYLFIEAELNLPQRAHDRIYSVSESIVAKMRGLVDMASPTPLWKELSAGLMKTTEGGTVPRGTFQRGESTGGRLARNWPPSQRVSWMAGVLPHLGLEDIYRQVERDKSWRDERNLKPGSLIVPPFLDPRFPEKTWYASLDSLGSRVQGATHYVGMAGVGLEAGDYKLDDPAVAKKLGAFGYDRAVPLKDVTDGVANTIMIIGVAPNYQRPWIAGGGATIMGAPEQRSSRPFVVRAQKGTHVIMLDGSVRFIAENISDDVFKALCTIKGGETIEDLEKVAPKAKPSTTRLTTDPDKAEDKPEGKSDDDKDK